MAEYLECHLPCNACALKSLSYQESLRHKRDFVFKYIGNLTGEIQLPCFISGNTAYRNKAVLHAEYQDGWALGVIQNEQVLDIDTCPVHAEMVNTVAVLLKKSLPPFEKFPLHCVAVSGTHLVLVLKTGFREIEQYAPFIPVNQLLKAGIKSIWLHANPSAGRKIFHKDFLYKVYGETYLQDEDGIYYHPLAFRQLLPSLHGLSLGKAEAFFAPGAHQPFVDLYCGIGISLKRWVQYGGPVLGVEMSGKALECAALNCPEAQTLRGSIEQRFDHIAGFISEAGSLVKVYANPPRSGLGPAVVNFIREQCRIESIVYLSCNPRSLKHDLEQLSSCFEIQNITLFDFFPYTRHVETQIYLARK